MVSSTCSATWKVIHRVAPACSSAATAACSAATVVLIRVLGEASRVLSWSSAAMPRAIRSRRASASRSTFEEDFTQVMR